MKRAGNVFSLVLILLHILYVNFILADLPVHVELSDLLGKWKIFRTKTSPTLTTCGSSQPNSNIYNVKIKDYKDYLIKNNYHFVSELYVILSDDFVSYGDMHDTTGNEHRKNWQVLVVYDEHKRKIGTWTTICDEGFEIRIGNETYTALMHYEPTGKCDQIKDDDATDSNGETECYITHFNKIRYGWIDISNPNNEQLYGCFYAERYHVNEDNFNEKQLPSTENSNNLQVYHNFTTGTSIHNVFNAHNLLYNVGNYDPPTYTKKSNANFDVNSELYWHKMKHHGKKKPITKMMSVYLKQKYACPCSADEDVQDEKNDGDSDKPVSPTFLQLGNVTQTDEETNELDLENFEDTLKSPSRELEINEMPKNFTWGDPFNNNTREYEVINQLLCGSCYIASQMYVFKRRIEIGLTKLLDKKYLNNFDDVLSVQTVLSCSFYDQGCNGGYPFLVSKLAKLQGIPLNKVFPYSGTNETCPYNVEKGPFSAFTRGDNDNEGMTRSSLREIKAAFGESRENDMHENFEYSVNADPEKWYAKDYNYIGGCYGCNQCNGEKIMMNEIYRNGPIVASFEASQDFYTYQDGIYFVKDFPHAKKCTIDSKKNKKYVYNVTGWEKVNHAIVLVGWGEEEINGKNYKYWIGRNSWGKEWGKDGYFKMIRGVNFSGIESQSLFIEPDFTRGAGKILLDKLRNQ
ncbi:dipeptidyl aminopeptidase 1, putative [Plasmodium ovale wallikeri]|uniref:dipeptidyl-peptidase I n=1 Tax=Plasmodium ovale wallikeri TaxID=864142 RepID=A0A1A8YVR9_PLAOA|nr:dipeptidyl aminopeptidase 1, putative [Plasmodium ovale wallikeri]